MPKQIILSLIFVLVAVLTQVFLPFTKIGDSYRPGVGALINGGVGFLFILLAGIAALVARRSRR